MYKARAFERRWVCLFTQPHRERLAFSSLREAGCDAYLPLCRKLVFRHGKRVDMRAPLFSRYIFATCREEQALFAASRLKGITSFAARTLEQSRISDRIIQSFRARHDEDGLVSLDPWHLQSGQSISRWHLPQPAPSSGRIPAVGVYGQCRRPAADAASMSRHR